MPVTSKMIQHTSHFSSASLCFFKIPFVKNNSAEKAETEKFETQGMLGEKGFRKRREEKMGAARLKYLKSTAMCILLYF